MSKTRQKEDPLVVPALLLGGLGITRPGSLAHRGCFKPLPCLTTSGKASCSRLSTSRLSGSIDRRLEADRQSCAKFIRVGFQSCWSARVVDPCSRSPLALLQGVNALTGVDRTLFCLLVSCSYFAAEAEGLVCPGFGLFGRREDEDKNTP